MLGYRERIGNIALYVYKPKVVRVLLYLYEEHGHFLLKLLNKKVVGKYF